jgi:hypothetical protein
VNDLRQRAPREQESPYLAFIAATCCVACLVEKGKINREVHVAHIRFSDAAAGWTAPGMQAKPDDRKSIGLCPPHHVGDVRKTRNTQHDRNEREFYEDLGVDIIGLCSALSDAFDAGRGGLPVVAEFAGKARACRIN